MNIFQNAANKLINITISHPLQTLPAPPVCSELWVQRVCEDVEVPHQPEQAERGAAAPADRGVEGDTPAQCRGHTAATPCADTHHRQEEARGHRSRMVTWSASPLAPVSPHLPGLNDGCGNNQLEKLKAAKAA